MEIREVELNENILSSLILLSKDWEIENSTYGYRENAKEDIEGRRIFVCEDDENIIGYLFGIGEKTKHKTSFIGEGEDYFEVEELYVKPEYRNQGVGRKLFNFAQSKIEKDYSCIMLSTATKNYKSILHFYIDELGMEFWNARLFKKLKGE